MQHDRLTRANSVRSAIGIGVAILLAAGFVIMAGVIVTAVFVWRDPDATPWHGLLALLPSGAAAFFISDAAETILNRRGRNASLSATQPILTATGPIAIWQDLEGNCTIGLGEELSLTVPCDLLRAITPGLHYALYYLNRPRQLLTAEPAQ